MNIALDNIWSTELLEIKTNIKHQNLEMYFRDHDDKCNYVLLLKEVKQLRFNNEALWEPWILVTIVEVEDKIEGKEFNFELCDSGEINISILVRDFALKQCP